jgi:hypothetical protein
MTAPADVRTDEEAFAACLAGRPVPAGAQSLSAFTDAVRASATEPGRPNAALAELLATGLLVPTQEPSRGTAGRPARTSRKRPHVLISTLTAKFAAAGAVAKAAAAGGVVAVALTGAATAGALPGLDDTAPVIESGDAADVTGAPQDNATGGETANDPTGGTDGTDGTDGTETGDTGGVSSTDVVADEDGDGSADEVSGGPAPETSVAEPELTQEEWATGPAEGQAFGDWVSQGARNGWVTGERVSDAAHKRNADRKAARDGAGTDEPAAAVPVEPAEPVQPAQPVEVAPAPAPAPTATDAGGSGRGNCGGHGHGNGNGNGGDDAPGKDG